MSILIIIILYIFIDFINTSLPGQIGLQFADDIFKCIS